MEQKTKISVKDLHLYYGENHALKGVNMEIRPNAVTAFIGPSGCGKSTFLKTLNRMNDLVDNVRIEGTVLLDGENIYGPGVDTTILRKKIGMVFQQPNPFPMSIYDNVAYGPRVHGIRDKRKLDQIVEESLRGAAIFGAAFISIPLASTSSGSVSESSALPPPKSSANTRLKFSFI